jgi:stage IV sporulation protein FB
MVAIAGILFQTLYFIIIVLLYNNHLIRDYIYNLFKEYNYHILMFNLLPIHPLDGSKILNLILNKIFPYKLTHKISIIVSIITLIILLYINYYNFNYTTILIISVIISNIIKYYHNINYLFNKFLLERYLYNFNYYKPKRITKIDNMYKEKYHIIKEKKAYFTEKELLKRRFNKKGEKCLTQTYIMC